MKIRIKVWLILEYLQPFSTYSVYDQGGVPITRWEDKTFQTDKKIKKSYFVLPFALHSCKSVFTTSVSLGKGRGQQAAIKRQGDG